MQRRHQLISITKSVRKRHYLLSKGHFPVVVLTTFPGAGGGFAIAIVIFFKECSLVHKDASLWFKCDGHGLPVLHSHLSAGDHFRVLVKFICHLGFQYLESVKFVQ